MTRRRLFTAGVVACAVGLIVHRRNRRARRSPGWTIPFAAIFGATRTAEINIGYPGTVLQNIGGFFGSIITSVIGDIASAVANALTWSLSVVQGWIASVWQGVLAIIGAIPGAFSSLVDYIEWFYNTFLDWTGFVLDEIAQGVVNAVSEGLDAGGWLAGLLTGWLGTILPQILQGAAWFVELVEGFATDVLRQALTVGSWLYNLIANVVQYVLDGIIGGGEYLWNLVEPFVRQLIIDAFTVGGWLYDYIRDSIVQPLIDFALAGISDVIDVVKGAWDFLVWVGEHGLAWFTDLADTIAGLSGDALLHTLEDAITGNEGTVEDLLDRLFG